MQPRSIEILKEYEMLLGDEGIELRKLYEEFWLNQIKQYCASRVEGKGFVFDQNVSHSEDRLKVVIPPPLRKEAIDEAARIIQGLMANTPIP